MPGLRGTPAGMTTRSHPYSASASWPGPVWAVMRGAGAMWERSAATPAVLATSYRRSSFTCGHLQRHGRKANVGLSKFSKRWASAALAAAAASLLPYGGAHSLSSRLRGWPMPPAAPSTATL